MSGEWIPVESRTIGKPEIGKLMVATRRPRHEIFGLLIHFWIWAEEHTVDGKIDMPPSVLPDFIGADDAFWTAVAAVGWLEALEDGAMRVPRADHWLTKGAKARLTRNRRQAKWRDSVYDRVDTQPSTAPTTTGQDRREQDIPVPVPGSCSSPETSESTKRIRGLKPDSVFHRMTLEALSDLAKLREWFDFQSTSPDPIGPQSVQEWKFCIAAAYQAREDGKRSKLGYFTTLFSKRRDKLTPKSLAIAEKAIQEAA